MIAVPLGFVLLLLALPGVWAAGRTLAAKVMNNGPLSAWLAPGFAVALWVLAVHVTGRITSSFYLGMTVGTLVVAGAGLVAWRRGWPATTTHPVPVRWLLLGAGLMMLLILPAALRWHLHDEIMLTGHLSIAEQMHNDIYPPRHLTFAQAELRYHYGFDLLCAMISAIFRTKIALTIDLLTTVSWGYTYCLLALLGRQVVGPRLGALTAVVVMLGGGLTIFCWGEPSTLVNMMTGRCFVPETMANPPTVSNFFQPPFTLGLPLAICAMLVFFDKSGRTWRLVGLGLLWCALSLSQIVLFVCVVASMVGAAAFVDRRWSPRAAGPYVAVAALAVIIATQLGGFFTTTGTSFLSGVEIAPLSRYAHWTAFLWFHVQTFGLLLPLGVVGFRYLRREQIFFALLAGGSLVVLECFQYRHSWDMVKFATIATIALSILASATIARIWQPAWQNRVAAACCLVATCSGVGFPVATGLDMEGLTPNVKQQTMTLSAADAAAARWLRHRVAAGDIVYVRIGTALAYAQSAGLPQLWTDDLVPAFGYDPAWLAARNELIRTLPATPEPYLEQGVRWFVVDPLDRRPPALIAHLPQLVQKGRAEIVKRFGALQIVALR